MTKPLPLVLLPGLHGTAELLQPLIRHLTLVSPVVPIDYPSDQLLSYDDLTHFVLARAPDGSFAVLGESFSGPVAIKVAAREARVSALILAATFARLPVPEWARPVMGWSRKLPIPPRAAAWMLAGRHATPALRAALTDTIAKLPSELIHFRLAAASTCDARAELAATRCPLLCLSGRRDWLTGRHALASIVTSRPDADVRRLDAGHMLLETHAGTAASAIEVHLRR